MKKRVYSAVMSVLIVLFFAVPAFPVTFLGGYDTPGFSRDIFVEDNRAYLADGYWGLKTFNVTDFGNIVQVDHYMPPYVSGRNAYNLLEVDNYLYVTDRTGGTHVMSMENPGSPTYHTTVLPEYKSNTLGKNGDYVFVGEVMGGLVALDANDPGSPEEVGRVKLPSEEHPKEAQGMAFKDNYAFVANPWGGMAVVDITDPASMEMVGYYDKPVGADPGVWDVAARGDYAFIVGQQYGLQVLDVSDPLNPLFFSELLLPNGVSGTIDDPPTDIKLFGEQAVVTNGIDGFYIVDLLDPANPSIAEHVEIDDFYAWGSYIEDDIIYVTNGFGGFHAYGASDYIFTAPLPSGALLFVSSLAPLIALYRRKALTSDT